MQRTQLITKHCRQCNARTQFEQHVTAMDCSDPPMVAVTLGLWLPSGGCMRALCGWLLCLTLAVGCGDSGPHNITIATKALITNGMTEDQVAVILGKPTVVAIDLGKSKVVQWSEGSGDSLRSIIVTFENGKAIQVAGTNLR